MSLDNPTYIDPRIGVGSVVRPRGFTATPKARFRVIGRNGPMLFVRRIADPAHDAIGWEIASRFTRASAEWRDRATGRRIGQRASEPNWRARRSGC